MSKITSLIYSKQLQHKIQQTHLLIVGVGGIGCQILKNISKSSFKKLTIIDLDIIQQTNLNRQFYFRKSHIKNSKAFVAKQQIQKINPSLKIKAICDNIFSPKYDVQFFSQFDIIISALDNQKARIHVAQMALKLYKPFIDAGTQGFYGNTRSIIRNLSSCYFCNQNRKKLKVFQQNIAVCTIRNHPQTPIHCIIYSKNFYECFFGGGGSKDNAFGGELRVQSYLKSMNKLQQSSEQLKQIGINIFNYLFYKKIQDKNLQNQKKFKDNPRQKVLINELNYKQSLLMNQVVENPASTFNQYEFIKQKNSIYLTQKLWSIAQYSQTFIESFVNIITSKFKELGSLKFQKDDQDCMNLVYSTFALRTYNYINYIIPSNKLKYLTFYQVKDIAGNQNDYKGKIIAAISSTNAIAAAIQIQQTIKVLNNEEKNLKYVRFNNVQKQRIVGLNFLTNNGFCEKCSLNNIEVILECNFDEIDFKELLKYLKSYNSYDRDLDYINELGQTISIISSKNKITYWLDFKISQFCKQYLKQNTLRFYFFPTQNTQMTLNISLNHNPSTHFISLINNQTPSFIRKNLVLCKTLHYNLKYQQKLSNFTDYQYS